MAARGGALALALAAAGCFSGDNTLGAVCGSDEDCGPEQGCTNEICGRCGDGIPQRGELCSVAAAELGAAPVASPGELLALDLDLDGRLDLLTRGAEGRPELWGGDGLGGWEVRARLEVGGAKGALRLAELDEDGAVDLVVVDEDAPSIGLGYGDGEGWSFGAPVVRASAPSDLVVAGASWGGPAWIAWVDAEGLVQAAIDPATGTLGEPAVLAGARAQWLGEPAALDADDALDLVVGDVAGQRLEVWRGDGAGGLTLDQTLPLDGAPTDVAVGDADGDGDPDVLVPDAEGGVTVILGDGEGALEAVERVVAPGAARAVTVADLDRDGGRDLLVTIDDAAPIWVFLSRGPRHPDGIALPVEGPVGAVLAIDGDRDGLTELLLGPVDGAAPLQIVEVEP